MIDFGTVMCIIVIIGCVGFIIEEVNNISKGIIRTTSDDAIIIQ